MIRYARTGINPCLKDGTPEKGRRIDVGDRLEINLTNGRPYPVTYPVRGGTRKSHLSDLTETCAMFNQRDYSGVPYPAKGYEKATVKSGGCGPTSAAICICTLLPGMEQSFSPKEAAALALRTGARVSGGTDMEALTRAAAREYGLRVVLSSDISKLTAHLSAGNAAVVHVGNNGLFSTGGHFIAAVGYKDGKIILCDPDYYIGRYGPKYPERARNVTVCGAGRYVLLKCTPAYLDRACSDRSPRYYLLSRG